MRGDWDGKEEREENKAVVRCLSIFILLLLRLPRKALRVIGSLGGRQPGDGETDRGGKMQRCRMKVKIIKSMQTWAQSTVERERNPVVVVVWSEGEGIRDKAGESIGSEDGLV
jgi:hypothetical protein